MFSRQALYFIIGSLPPILFGLRFFIQWIASEKKKKSYVTPLFWRISILANSLFALHYFIQMQLPFFLLQVGNGFIARRNLQIQTKDKVRPFSGTLISLFICLSLALFAFGLQRKLTGYVGPWLGNPAAFSSKETITMGWHVLGILGTTLFASRFWIQWLQVEKRGESYLSNYFWIASIIGSLLSLTYFIRLTDWVSIVSYGFGLIPYLRNFMLLNRKPKVTSSNQLQ